MERFNASESGGSIGEPPRITAALVDFRLTVDDRTHVRLLHAGDAELLHDLTARNRDFLVPWMTWVDRVAGVSDTYAYLRAAEREAHEHTAFKAGIVRDGALIGCIDLHDVDWVNSIARVGYWLDAEHTGQGIMSRATRLLVEYAFEALGLHRIEIRVATGNAASRRIPERLGFTLEGVLRQVQHIGGVYLDHALYALLRDEQLR